MNHSLELFVEQFLKKHHKPDKPLLLALSGGPDSLALFYLLLKYRQNSLLNFSVAHVDHGWREESAAQALQLSELAHLMQVPFYLKKIHPGQLNGNLEAACREERLRFFEKLSQEHDFQAVLVAHHADDQAETVLKRVLEGSSLTSLGSLCEQTNLYGIQLWRPLLKFSKSELQKWLENEGHKATKAFEDSTNLDPKFLRGKFRVQIIPQLAKDFGKEVCHNLQHLADEAQEVNVYFQERLKEYLHRIERSKRGLFLDLSMLPPMEPLELKMLVTMICQQNNVCLSRPQRQLAVKFLEEGASNKQIIVGSHCLYIDRKKMFLFEKKSVVDVCVTVVQPLETGCYGDWSVSVSRCDAPKAVKTGWKHVWDGHLEVYLPEGQYEIGPAKLSDPFPGETATISKWWTNAKVPSFLRNAVPVISQDGHIKHEFLSGRCSESNAEDIQVRCTLSSNTIKLGVS